MDSLYLGLMSGTSVDGIDCLLARFPEPTKPEVLQTHNHAIPAELREEAHALGQAGDNEINRLGKLDRQLGALFAEAAKTLLNQAGVRADNVTAIGCHGQTIRHAPPSAGNSIDASFTLQIGDPNTIAELTGITTIADFRRRDIAASGEGAPLAPAFHAAVFSRPAENRAIINIGGISNVSLLKGTDLHAGFDTGPGNTLMDLWTLDRRGQPYDQGGNWAASGTVDCQLLETMLADPYYQLATPKSTGKELFNRHWLERHLANHTAQDQDVQATLVELTALTIADGIAKTGVAIDSAYVCGGGAHNDYLMRRLQMSLGEITLADTGSLGIDPDWVEAAAFAWLAKRTLDHLPGNCPAVTGARGERILGGIYLP